jgi:hypothetical protein
MPSSTDAQPGAKEETNMLRPRVHIANLIMAVVVCAVGMAALNGQLLWFCGLFTATIAGLLVAVLGAIFRSGPARAFCTGAALCGAAYLTLVYYKSTCDLLLTDKFVREASERANTHWPTPPPATAGAVAQAQWREAVSNYLVNWNGVDPRSVFAGVAHLMFSWLFAVLGGFTARRFATIDRAAT